MSAGRILIADDEPDVAGFVQTVAVGCGYDAFAVSSVDELHQRLRHGALTHIILDLNMPGLDGVEVLRLLAQGRCQAKIVIFSGVDRKIRDAAHRLGVELGLEMAGVLAKPVRLDELRSFLENLRTEAPQVTGSQVADAIAAGELFLEYQPKMALPGRTLAGAEALVRWRRPDGTVLAPGAFLPQVEKTAIIRDLTWTVIAEALDQLVVWSREGIRCPVSINLSSQNLYELDLADRLQQMCDERSLSPGLITLELTETAAVGDQVHSMDVLTRLRLKGFGLSIDDFGTGYSSIAQLHRLPFDELKIDRSFVSELGISDDAMVIVRTTIELAHNLSLRVCAEGVETTAALATLERLGCDMVQGFHISRPMAGTAFPKWAVRLAQPAEGSSIVSYPGQHKRSEYS